MIEINLIFSLFLINKFKEIIPFYRDSPCTNTRSSSFKLGINPIKKEIETIWSEWLNCLKDEEKTYRARTKIFKHIRKYSAHSWTWTKTKRKYLFLILYIVKYSKVSRIKSMKKKLRIVSHQIHSYQRKNFFKNEQLRIVLFHVKKVERDK